MSYKVKIQDLAEMMAGDDGYEYVDLSPSQQDRYYKKALEEYYDNLADIADLRRKNEADGGMMRKNYAVGSEEDIPEVEEMPSDEYMDLLKSIGADKEQASGIRSIKNKKMASQPDPMDERNMVMEAIAMEEFGKPLRLLNEEEIIQIEEMLNEMSMKKRKAPSIKMAEYRPGDTDPVLLEEYEKYIYDMQEQGMEPMPLQDYIRMVIGEARMGVRSGGITSIM
jgi:hypothetical protein